MEQLPILQREVVYMRYYQQLTFKEIAEATGVSINTSLGRMRYALLNLRRMAKKHDVYLQLDLYWIFYFRRLYPLAVSIL